MTHEDVAQILKTASDWYIAGLKYGVTIGNLAASSEAVDEARKEADEAYEEFRAAVVSKA